MEQKKPFIHIEDLSYAYVGDDGSAIPVLKHISLDIREGEYVTILGHNGSGKSTLAKLLNMVIDDYTYAEGSILVDGLDVMSPDVTDEDVLTLRRNVGMVFQNPDNQLVATVVEEDVAFGPENLGVPHPELRTRVDHDGLCPSRAPPPLGRAKAAGGDRGHHRHDAAVHDL